LITVNTLLRDDNQNVTHGRGVILTDGHTHPFTGTLRARPWRFQPGTTGQTWSSSCKEPQLTSLLRRRRPTSERPQRARTPRQSTTLTFLEFLLESGRFPSVPPPASVPTGLPD